MEEFSQPMYWRKLFAAPITIRFIVNDFPDSHTYSFSHNSDKCYAEENEKE